MKFGILGILVFLFVGNSVNAETAKVYKWVDEDGVAHFTSTPPPGADGYEKMNIRTPNVANSTPTPEQPVEGESEDEEDSGPETPEQFLERRRLEAEESRAKAAEAQQMQEQCSTARRALTFYTTHVRVSEPTSDGATVRRLTEEERQAKIADAEGRVAQYCTP